MCFSVLLQLPPTLLPAASDAADKQAPDIEDRGYPPPPSTFQRKCKTKGTPTNRMDGQTAKAVAVQHFDFHGVYVKYAKDPIWKSELCTADTETCEIEESVRIFEAMLDLEILDRA